MGNSICGKSPSIVLKFCTKELKEKKYSKNISTDDLKICADYERQYRNLLILRLRRHLEGNDLSSSEMKKYIEYSIIFEELACKILCLPIGKGYKESITEDCASKFELSQIETECHMLDIIYGMIQAEVIYDILNNPKLLGRHLEDSTDDISKAIKKSNINMRELQKKTIELANVSKSAIQNWYNWSIL